MRSNSEFLSKLQELLDLAQAGCEDGERVMDLATDLRSADRVYAHIEGDVSREYVKFGRDQGSCLICGGGM